ncbi:prostaglandin F synthase 1-like [Eurosta solidaginis]|uniref:prostaglandin F synthase 1-like n=1 Tax=Eurosta solidaginis TaxID=178769 RepID=UPI003530CDB1
MATSPFISLNDGNKMPTMGINTFNVHVDDLSFNIRGAINAGYTHIDTSMFNSNEQQIGKTLKEMMDRGKVKRTDLFITTKLPPTANVPESVQLAIMHSLTSLKLDYVDLYLIQAPVGLVPDERFDVLKWNNDRTVCLDYSTDHIKLWKIEYHIYLQQPSLVEFCEKQQIVISAYAPLGAQDLLFTNNFTGIKRVLPKLVEIPDVKGLATKYKKTETQVLLRWILDKGYTFVLRMSNSDRMKEIQEIQNFSLKHEDIAILNRLDRGFRYVDFKFIKGIESHPEYPF